MGRYLAGGAGDSNTQRIQALPPQPVHDRQMMTLSPFTGHGSGARVVALADKLDVRVAAATQSMSASRCGWAPSKAAFLAPGGGGSPIGRGLGGDVAAVPEVFGILSSGDGGGDGG